MNRYTKYFLFFFFIFLFLILSIKPALAEDSEVVVEFFYYSGYCEHCEEKKPIVNDIEEYFDENITVERYPIDVDEYYDNWQKFRSYGFKDYPAVVVKNTTAEEFNLLFFLNEITFDNLKNAIDYHLEGNYSEKPPEVIKDQTYCLFDLICFDASELSLPVLTVAMAFLDSFNPCAFFILIFLLNLLMYVRSRRRMLLIGGIFIFFSGFIYFLLMAALLKAFLIVEHQLFITVIAGIFAVGFGLLNIKDFFRFKQGPSLSISKEKKSDLFMKMRKLIKTTYLPAVIVGTVVLAIFANTYELLCSLGLPLVYTSELATHNLGDFEYYLYLFFYNVIYVIPLLVILLIFVIKLDGKKLSEWQGRLLKLISGIMMFSLGIVLLIKPELLKNVFSALGIILISILVSFFISFIWKKKSPSMKTSGK